MTLQKMFQLLLMFLSNFQRLTNFKKGITNSLPEMSLMTVKCVRGLFNQMTRPLRSENI